MNRWAALILILLGAVAPAHILAQIPLLQDDEAQTACAKRVDTLILQLKDKDSWSRWEAVQCLGKLKDPRGTEPLVQALYAEAYPRGVSLIQRILKDIDDPRTTELLLRGLNTRRTRWRSIYALGAIGAPEAIEPLLVILKGTNNEDRRAAADALGGIKDKRVLTALLLAFRDKDEILRRYIATSLGELEDANATDVLIEGLKDSDDGVRWNSITSLGKLKASRAVQPLLAVFDDEKEREEIRRDAVTAIGDIGEPSAIDPLVERFRYAGSTFRGRLSKALARFDSPSVDEVLINSLRQGEYEVVAAAHSYYIRKADPSYISVLIAALREHGDYEVAQAYIDSGNPDLVQAGSEWVKRQHPVEFDIE